MAAITGARQPGSGVLAGGVAVLARAESSDSAFAVAAPAATVRGPSGAAAATPSVTPGGSALSHVLQVVVTEALPGAYTVGWVFGAGSETVVRADEYFVGRTDLRRAVRSLLRVDNLTLTDEDADAAVKWAVDELFHDPGVASTWAGYGSVSDADGERVDRAVALLTAAAVRPYTPKQSATGEVVKFQAGTDSYSWSQPVRSGEPESIEEGWERRAWQLLLSTEAGPALEAATPNGVALSVNGWRRGVEPPLVTDRLGGSARAPWTTLAPPPWIRR